MALAVTAKDSASNNLNQTSYTTASVSFTANALALIAIHTPSSQAGADPAAPTVSGGGMTTWTAVAGYLFDNAGATRGRVDIFRALEASPGAAAQITIDYAAVQMAGCAYSVLEFTGVDTTGANGAGAVVQSVTGALNPAAALSATLTLAALGSANNAAFGLFAHQANELTTPGAGYTEIHDVANSAPVIGTQTEWQLNVTTVDASWATSSVFGCIAVEIKAAGGATVTFDGVIAGQAVIVADTVRQRALDAVVAGAATVVAGVDATRLFEAVTAGQAVIVATLDLPAGAAAVIVDTTDHQVYIASIF